ncbi:MAG: GGDEF domain-containing protein [Ferrimicrobium sp.]
MHSTEQPPTGFDLQTGLEALLDVASKLATITDEDELLLLIAESVCSVLRFGLCSIALRDDDDVYRIRSFSGSNPKMGVRELLRYELPVSSYELIERCATRIGSILWIDGRDPILDELESEGSIIATEPSTPSTEWHPRSLLLVPLKGPTRGTFGLLCPDDPLNGLLPSRERATLLETFAHFASLAIQLHENRSHADARLRILEAQRQRLSELFQRSTDVQRSRQLEGILRTTATAVTAAGGFRRCAIYLRTPGTDLLEIRMSSGVTPEDELHLRRQRVPLATFQAMMAPQMRISNSYLFDHRRFSLPAAIPDYLSVPEDRSEGDDNRWHPEDSLTIPLYDSEAHLVGLISVDEPNDGRFPDLDQIQALEFFADQAAVAVTQATRHDQLVTLAETDALTGAHNRRMLKPLLERLIRSTREIGSGISILFLDIDHFKEINDTYGHVAGDEVLRTLTKALLDRLRSHDIVVRYGGEEFVIGISGADETRATSIAESIRQLVELLDFDELPDLHIHCSIGVAPASASALQALPSDVVITELLRRADAALYEAKQHGRNRTQSAATLESDFARITAPPSC